MEEDALNQPTAAGKMLLMLHKHLVFLMRLFIVISFPLLPFFLPEADVSLHTLSESPCGSLVVYVIPESSSLLPQVQTQLYSLKYGHILLVFLFGFVFFFLMF